jgi:hypothetical protein
MSSGSNIHFEDFNPSHIYVHKGVLNSTSGYTRHSLYYYPGKVEDITYTEKGEPKLPRINLILPLSKFNSPWYRGAIKDSELTPMGIKLMETVNFDDITPEQKTEAKIPLIGYPKIMVRSSFDISNTKKKHDVLNEKMTGMNHSVTEQLKGQFSKVKSLKKKADILEISGPLLTPQEKDDETDDEENTHSKKKQTNEMTTRYMFYELCMPFKSKFAVNEVNGQTEFCIGKTKEIVHWDQLLGCSYEAIAIVQIPQVYHKEGDKGRFTVRIKYAYLKNSPQRFSAKMPEITKSILDGLEDSDTEDEKEKTEDVQESKIIHALDSDEEEEED